MGIRSVLAAVVVTVGLAASADPMNSQSTVARGVWCSNFAASKAYAEDNNIPLIVFWANPGCSQCEKMEKALNKDDFKAWQVAQNAVMVFSYNSGKDHDACKTFVKNASKQFPYMAVYWKSNTQGKEVLEKFTGRSGMMSTYGASSSDDLQKQFMDAVEDILPDWEPNGGAVTPPVGPDDPDEPDPQPVYYTVTFVVDAAKGSVVNGDLTQRVESGKGATAPTVTALEGWKFTGWDKSFSKVTKNLTVTAKFSAVSVEPDPEPGDRDEVDVLTVYKRAKSLSALAYGEDGELAGTATLKIGKISSRTHKVKVSLSIKRFTGGTSTASYTGVPNGYGDIEGTLPFRTSAGGNMDFVLVYNEGEFMLDAANDTYSVELGSAKLGGAFDTDELSFFADIDIELDDDWDWVVGAPMGEPVHVRKGTKFSFDKTPSIKYKKIREDGETYYELVGLDDEIKTNVSGLKLSYKSTTGVFTGSFKMYCSNALSIAEGKAPKLKKITVKVSGIVVDGRGFGVVSYGRTTGSCSLD